MFTEEQIMMCLAGIAYRGYALNPGPLPVPELLRPPIERGLRTMAPLEDRWELVWGPALYRASLTLFDEKLVYVVRDRAQADRYVVVVRGTNPISASDWLFGDLWTARQVPWRYGDADDKARVSLSASISLSIVQGLRSTAPHNDAAARVWRNVDQRLTQLRDGVGFWHERRQQLTNPVFAPLRRQVLDWAQRLATINVQTHVNSEARLLQYLRLWQSSLRARLYDLADWASARLGQSFDRIVLPLIEQDARMQSASATGVDLQTFLAAAVDHARGPVSVTVTGHSKAGAVASTVALWLAETQGSAAPEQERWDPERRAQVHCYSFAGPTAGNAAFAERSRTLLGDRCHRIWNELDIVPHAWTVDDLGKVPDLYLPNIQRLKVVADLVDALQHHVAALAYQQVDGVPRTLRGKYAADKPNFFAQLAHQHLDAYLIELDLVRYGVTQKALFDDLPLAA